MKLKLYKTAVNLSNKRERNAFIFTFLFFMFFYAICATAVFYFFNQNYFIASIIIPFVTIYFAYLGPKNQV